MPPRNRTRNPPRERGQEELPIQPVKEPILSSPYEEPSEHWLYERPGEPTRVPGRRPASYWYRSRRTGAAQLAMFAEEERDDIPLVNALRADVKRWRDAGYRGATPVTKKLLAHWANPERGRRLFFCQLEAVETVIYLREILWSTTDQRTRRQLPPEDLQRLLRAEPISFLEPGERAVAPRLIDAPADPALSPLVRLGCKMATGSGKTIVMAMLVAWAFCNRGRRSGDTRFPSAALVVCPNLTIRERLQVLRPERADNYYEAFDLVPSTLLPELRKGRVLIENWHRFAPEGANVESGASYRVVNKGEERAEAFARRVLGDIAQRGRLLVLNDEAHHAYRPAPIPEDADLTADERAEREEATVWVAGLDRIHEAVGVELCVDLSATPFYLQGSGYLEGSPFPWLVSDFGLVDAIESGIVKIPRLPVSDTTGRPEPRYFALWRTIVAGLEPGEKLPGGKPKPDVVWREAEDALKTLASQWVQRFEQVRDASPLQEHVPPVLIIVCDNTDIAELFFRKISGQQEVEVAVGDDSDDEEEGAPRPRRRGTRKRIAYGTGELFPEYFSNNASEPRRTLRIDSKLLAQAEGAGGTGSRQAAAEELREIVATVGKRGQPGEQVRCIVSVQMLTEGWDANNVTHVFGLRAFESQLLCEQVVGRGLRRMDYVPDPETGRLTEEYVDVYGVPFSVIPFRGRSGAGPEPVDRPKNHIRALEEREALAIRFPVVEGYAFALRHDLICADVAAMEQTELDAAEIPDAVYVKPQVGYQVGTPGLGGFSAVEHDREAYYASTHPQTIRFEIARRVVEKLQSVDADRGARPLLRSRHQLFPQVYALVERYVATKVRLGPCHPCELGLERYVARIVDLLVAAIRPDDARGEAPLLPILNRYHPIGDTGRVDFKTTRPVFATAYSHVNAVAADTVTWEQTAAFRLEQAAAAGGVVSYARNDHLELTIPYDFQGLSHAYEPDFLVRLSDGSSLVLEIKGQEDAQDRAKHEAARRWTAAVNHWGKLGTWRFHVCRDPLLLGRELRLLEA